MIRCYHIVEDVKAASFFCLEKPLTPSSSIFSEFKQKFSLVASLCQMPDVTWKKITTSPYHSFSLLIRRFGGHKFSIKNLFSGKYIVISLIYRYFRRSDPIYRKDPIYRDPIYRHYL